MKTLIKKSISLALAFATLLSLSCCGVNDEPISEPPIIEATKATPGESATQTLSEEELNELAQNMPEIVFVMSHHYDEATIKTNILGFYITNTGEMKMYDFRQIAPDEMYEIPDVYDRLEEATCLELDFGGYPNSENITENDMIPTSQKELTEYYKKLLLITKEAVYSKKSATLDTIMGNYKYYGIRNNSNGEKECILFWGRGNDHDYTTDDIYAGELNNLMWEKFFNHLYYAD